MQIEEEKGKENELSIMPQPNNQGIDNRLKLGEYICKNKATFPYELSKISEDKETIVIYLKHLRLGTIGAVHLSVLLNFYPRLQRLNLADNMLCASGMNSLASALSNLVNLIDLHLEMNFMKDGAKSLGIALKSLSKLEILNLSDNDIDSESIVELSRGLSHLKKLKVLKMNFNSFKTNGTIAFANALVQMQQLEILQLFCCEIETQGALALFQNFKECRSLKNVTMGKNDDIASSLRGKMKRKYKFVHTGVDEPVRCEIF
ncbi:unnamed protein product [Blepharisma stoltei]|uniref:Uncharacterized protein n=1 Tax=Blepharisma stoltei TaxID=1481888 RepID=A0AAU9IDM1_9CILI|nr:unnamed protein product [Blepharisma stoltei]